MTGRSIIQIPARLAMLLIRSYQCTLSHWIGQHCRFTPTCSQYTYEAIEKRGLLKGGYHGLKRIIKCNPCSKGGYDPVE